MHQKLFHSKQLAGQAVRTGFRAVLFGILILQHHQAAAQSANRQDTCSIIVQFPAKAVYPGMSMKKQLDSLVQISQQQPALGIYIIGDASTGCSPQGASAGVREWDRVNHIANYLVGKGVNENRIVFSFGDIPVNQLIIRLQSLDPATAQPHPNLRRKTPLTLNSNRYKIDSTKTPKSSYGLILHSK